jgi:excisionase family DNA binding protein
VAATVNGIPVELQLDEAAMLAIADAVPKAQPPDESPYLTIPEAAVYLRCKRQRVDDLLSQRRLTRFKDGARTLVSRAEIETYLTAVSY